MRGTRIWLVLLITSALVACGGGGSGSNSSATAGANSQSSLTGTVAVGVPLQAAIITIKDADGTMLRATTDDDGTYTIADVENLRYPILIRAEGDANGVPQIFYSVLAEKPASGPLIGNVTPMTNAIVAQFALGDPDRAFKSQGIELTQAKLDGASAKLAGLLSPLMQQVGAQNGTDLVRTRFSADSQGLDKVLDLVTITNDVSGGILAGKKSDGVLKSISASDSLSDVTNRGFSSENSNIAGLDFSKVRLLVSALNRAVVSGAPIRSEMAQLLDASYLNNGESTQGFLDAVTAEPPPEGSRISNFTIGTCRSDIPVCQATGSWVDAQGVYQEPFDMPIRYANGGWKFYGNQQPFKTDFLPVLSLLLPNKTTLDRSDVRRGFWFDQSGLDDKYASGYDTVKILLSADSGVSYYEAWTLVRRSGCNTLVTTDSLAQNGCSNFLDASFVNDSRFSTIRDDFRNGLVRVKIRAFGNGVELAAVNFRPKFQIYNDAEAWAIAGNVQRQINFADLGSSQMTLLPRVHFINTDLFPPGNTYPTLGNLRLNGVDKFRNRDSLTLEEICSMSPDAATCRQPHSSKIWSAFQNLRLPNDPYSMVWVSYSKSPN